MLCKICHLLIAITVGFRNLNLIRESKVSWKLSFPYDLKAIEDFELKLLHFEKNGSLRNKIETDKRF